jgi:hypothetical protein
VRSSLIDRSSFIFTLHEYCLGEVGSYKERKENILRMIKGEALELEDGHPYRDEEGVQGRVFE